VTPLEHLNEVKDFHKTRFERSSL